jgi:hypothetical protein
MNARYCEHEVLEDPWHPAEIIMIISSIVSLPWSLSRSS